MTRTAGDWWQWPRDRDGFVGHAVPPRPTGRRRASRRGNVRANECSRARSTVVAVPIRVQIEEGGKRVFASAVDWPGWSRSGRTAAEGLAALVDYADRYRAAIAASRTRFPARVRPGDLAVVETTVGTSSTDFGVPAAHTIERLAQTDSRELLIEPGLIAARCQSDTQSPRAGFGDPFSHTRKHVRRGEQLEMTGPLHRPDRRLVGHRQRGLPTQQFVGADMASPHRLEIIACRQPGAVTRERLGPRVEVGDLAVDDHAVEVEDDGADSHVS